MEDNGFDLCECIWGRNMAMRRLLSFLRGSQAYCTDNECLNELPLSNVNTSDPNLFFIAICWFLLAILLYYLRPNTFRRREDVLKIRNNENDSSDHSSAPPPLD